MQVTSARSDGKRNAPLATHVRRVGRRCYHLSQACVTVVQHLDRLWHTFVYTHHSLHFLAPNASLVERYTIVPLMSNAHGALRNRDACRHLADRSTRTFDPIRYKLDSRSDWNSQSDWDSRSTEGVPLDWRENFHQMRVICYCYYMKINISDYWILVQRESRLLLHMLILLDFNIKRNLIEI